MEERSVFWKQIKLMKRLRDSELEEDDPEFLKLIEEFDRDALDIAMRHPYECLKILTGGDGSSFSTVTLVQSLLSRDKGSLFQKQIGEKFGELNTVVEIADQANLEQALALSRQSQQQVQFQFASSCSSSSSANADLQRVILESTRMQQPSSSSSSSARRAEVIDLLDSDDEQAGGEVKLRLNSRQDAMVQRLKSKGYSQQLVLEALTISEYREQEALQLLQSGALA